MEQTVADMVHSVRTNTALLTLSLVGQKVLAFIYFALIARVAGVEVTGRYASALAFTTLISILADAGLTPVVIREVAKERSRAPTLLASIMWFKAGLAALTVVTIVVLAHVVDFSLAVRSLIYVAATVVIFDATSVLLYGVLRGYQNLWYESFGMLVGQALVLVVGGVSLFLKAPAEYLVAALAVGSGWNVWYALRTLRRVGFHFFSVPSREVRAFVIRAAIPFALAGIFTRVYAQIDTVFVARILGEHAAGIYSIPQKVGFAFQFIPVALAAALYPALAQYVERSRSEAALLFERALVYLAALALPLCTLIFALAPQIVRGAFGAAYEASVLPLQIVIISIIFGFLDFPFGSLLNATGRQSLQTLSMGITMLINVLLNLFLIPRWGVVGAALTALVSQIVLFLSGAIFVRGMLPWRPFRVVAPTVGACAASLAAGLLAFALRAHVHFAVAGIAGGTLYVLCILWFRVVRPQELKALISEIGHMRGTRRDGEILPS